MLTTKPVPVLRRAAASGRSLLSELHVLIRILRHYLLREFRGVKLKSHEQWKRKYAVHRIDICHLAEY